VEIGVFGGSFDPPHLGHLNVARDALEWLELDQVLFVPARRSPFKGRVEGAAPGAVRKGLCEAAIREEPGMAVWDGELHRPEPSYTVDTLASLQEPGRRLTLLLGADQWAQFHRWREPRRILDMARVGVLTRGGYEGPDGPSGDGPWPCVRVPVRRIEVSSTEIRRRARAGRSIRFLVPEAVRRIIEHQSLYGSGTGSAAGIGARSS
jgi:nicotinate-nucleotide adenylyltransferase